ncbi:MAG: hypothetical protein KAQ63_00765 [Candidatus Moranbacteria bacterium]|nr:hypothetical protein [Candidatus Moranbacteria bacterium]
MLKTESWCPEKIYEDEYLGWVQGFETERYKKNLPNDSFVRVIVHSIENDALEVIDKIIPERFIPRIERMNFQDTAFFFEIYPEKIECKISRKGQSEITRLTLLDNPPEVIIGAEVERLIEKFLNGFSP